jgi:hypothetical protein
MKLRVLLYCLLGGLPLAISALGAGHPGWFWLSGIVLAGGFVPVALFGPRRWAAQFGVVALAVWIISVLCTASEAWLFVPDYRLHAVRNVVGGSVIYLIFAAVLALLAWVFKLSRPSDYTVEHRSVASTAFLILVSGFAYVIYYLIFGAITYQFFTKSYYPEATQQVGQLGLWFWVIQMARGILMTLAVVPVIYTLRMSRVQAALSVGALVWIAGGLSPLLLPNEFMGTTQRMIHIVEILTQNASLGITAVLLLRPRAKAMAGQLPLAHASQ